MTPSKTAGCVGQGRWLDFIDVAMPVPDSSQIVLGGTLASPSDTIPHALLIGPRIIYETVRRAIFALATFG